MGLFVRAVVRKLISSWVEHELSAFTDGQFVEGDSAADPVYVHRLQVRYLTAPSGQDADTFENVLHFVDMGTEVPGGPTDAAHKLLVENAFDTFWTTAKASAPNWVGLSEYRWFRLTLGDPLTGPNNRQVIKSTPVAGTQSAAWMPPQSAETITLRTAIRRHWGRIYLPIMATGGGGTGRAGQLSDSQITSILGAFRTFANSCVSANLIPVIYSPSKQSALSITEMEMDTVPDVVRRRRPHRAFTKLIYNSPS